MRPCLKAAPGTRRKLSATPARDRGPRCITRVLAILGRHAARRGRAAVFRCASIKGVKPSPHLWPAQSSAARVSGLPLRAYRSQPLAAGAEGSAQADLRRRRVELDQVDRISLTVLRMGDKPVRRCQSPFVPFHDEPPRLAEPLLPKGRSSTSWVRPRREWAGKSKSVRRGQPAAPPRHEASSMAWPQAFPRWGGWKGRRVDGTGFFRTYHDGSRWWLVDPESAASDRKSGTMSGRRSNLRCR